MNDEQIKWDALYKRFIRRVKLLQKSADRELLACHVVCPDCTKQFGKEYTYCHGSFTWTTSLRHRVRKHNERIAKVFWTYVLAHTVHELKMSKAESTMFLEINQYQPHAVNKAIKAIVDQLFEGG